MKPLSRVATSIEVVGLSWEASWRSVQLALGTDPAVVDDPQEVNVMLPVKAEAGRTAVGVPVV